MVEVLRRSYNPQEHRLTDRLNPCASTHTHYTSPVRERHRCQQKSEPTKQAPLISIQLSFAHQLAALIIPAHSFHKLLHTNPSYSLPKHEGVDGVASKGRACRPRVRLHWPRQLAISARRYPSLHLSGSFHSPLMQRVCSWRAGVELPPRRHAQMARETPSPFTASLAAAPLVTQIGRCRSDNAPQSVGLQQTHNWRPRIYIRPLRDARNDECGLRAAAAVKGESVA